MPGGRTSTWSYDPVGRVAGATDPAGVVSRLTRDAAGFVTSVVRGSDGWDVDLDPAGRELRRTAPDGSVLGEYRYDAAGRLAEASNPSGWSSQFLWDDDDRITAIVDTSGTTLIERDGDGWATAMTQPDGVRTIIDRDLTGRIVGVHDDVAGGAVIPTPDAEFDVAGRLVLGPDGTVYRYDDAGRLAEIAPPDGDTVAFEYGTDGLIATEHRVGITRHFVYDDAGRVAAITVDGGRSTRFVYDDAGRRVGEFRSDGTELHFGWSGLDRLTEIVHVAPGGEHVHVSIEVDALGRPRRVGGQVVDYDPMTSLPSRIGETRIVNLPGLAWRSDRECGAAPDPRCRRA